MDEPVMAEITQKDLDQLHADLADLRAKIVLKDERIVELKTDLDGRVLTNEGLRTAVETAETERRRLVGVSTESIEEVQKKVSEHQGIRDQLAEARLIITEVSQHVDRLKTALLQPE